MNKIHEYVGVDLGMSRSGIARGNSAARLAEPLGTSKTSELVDNLKAISKKNDADGIVFGLPRSLNGQDTEQTKWTRQWVHHAKTQLGLPIYLQDEALSSRDAAKIQKSKFKNQKNDEHSNAAAIILQDFLDTPEQEREVC